MSNTTSDYAGHLARVERMSEELAQEILALRATYNRHLAYYSPMPRDISDAVDRCCTAMQDGITARRVTDEIKDRWRISYDPAHVEDVLRSKASGELNPLQVAIPRKGLQTAFYSTVGDICVGLRPSDVALLKATKLPKTERAFSAIFMEMRRTLKQGVGDEWVTLTPSTRAKIWVCYAAAPCAKGAAVIYEILGRYTTLKHLFPPGVDRVTDA